MRPWIRSRLTYANVAATLALFLVISGGTAAAVTYVVSSNSQIGPNTISGHSPPSGKHANIIGGSVNGTDVNEPTLNGSQVTGVNAAKLGGKTSSDFLPSSAVHTGRVTSNDPLEDGNGTRTILLNTGTFQVWGYCENDSTTDMAEISLVPPAGTSVVSQATGNGITNNLWDAPSNLGLVIAEAPHVANAPEVHSAHLIAVSSSSKVLSGDVSAEINDSNGGGSDCTFGYDLVGG